MVIYGNESFPSWWSKVRHRGPQFLVTFFRYQTYVCIGHRQGLSPFKGHVLVVWAPFKFVGKPGSFSPNKLGPRLQGLNPESPVWVNLAWACFVIYWPIVEKVNYIYIYCILLCSLVCVSAMFLCRSLKERVSNGTVPTLLGNTHNFGCCFFHL